MSDRENEIRRKDLTSLLLPSEVQPDLPLTNPANIAYFAQKSVEAYSDPQDVKLGRAQLDIMSDIKKYGISVSSVAPNNLRQTFFDSGSTQAYVFHDSGANAIIVAFRGTESLADWMIDAKTGIKESHLLKRGIHEGFNDALNEKLPGRNITIREAIDTEVARINSEQASNGKEKPALYATGHSLGGALALTWGAEKRDVEAPNGIITFGQPAVYTDGAPIFLNSVSSVTNERGQPKKIQREYVRVAAVDDLFAGISDGPFNHGIRGIYFDNGAIISDMSGEDFIERKFTPNNEKGRMSLFLDRFKAHSAQDYLTDAAIAHGVNERDLLLHKDEIISHFKTRGINTYSIRATPGHPTFSGLHALLTDSDSWKEITAGLTDSQKRESGKMLERLAAHARVHPEFKTYQADVANPPERPGPFDTITPDREYARFHKNGIYNGFTTLSDIAAHGDRDNLALAQAAFKAGVETIKTAASEGRPLAGLPGAAAAFGISANAAITAGGIGAVKQLIPGENIESMLILLARNTYANITATPETGDPALKAVMERSEGRNRLEGENIAGVYLSWDPRKPVSQVPEAETLKKEAYGDNVSPLNNVAQQTTLSVTKGKL